MAAQTFELEMTKVVNSTSDPTTTTTNNTPPTTPPIIDTTTTATTATTATTNIINEQTNKTSDSSSITMKNSSTTPPPTATVATVAMETSSSSSPLVDTSSSLLINSPPALPASKATATATSSSISAIGTVRTRRNNNALSGGSSGGSGNGVIAGKSSVFQLVKSKATTSSLATSSVMASNHHHHEGSNEDHIVDSNGGSGGHHHHDLEKSLPKIDLNRNMDLFAQSTTGVHSNSTSSSGVVNNRREHVDDSPIAKHAFEGKTKFAHTRLGRMIRRIVNHIRVWSNSPFIKYTVIILMVLLLIALIGNMFIVPIMFKSSSTSDQSLNDPSLIEKTVATEDKKITPPTPPNALLEKEGKSLWERISSVFSRSESTDSSTTTGSAAPVELILTLSPDKYNKEENFESYYLSQSKPIVLKKYGSKWISSSTWKKEFTSNTEFIARLKKMKKQLAKYVKRKGISITLVNLDKLPASVHRVPFTPNLKEHEFEYDFPTSLDQFSTLKTLYSEIWFAAPKKDKMARIGRKENSNKFTICMIADSWQYSQLVQLTSPSGEETETEIKTNDCIYIPSGWSFDFNVKASTKFVSWIYE